MVHVLNFSGDKSLTHRLYMLQLLGLEIQGIENLSKCADCESTQRVIHQIQNWDRKKDLPLVLDCGNSGTTMRLLAGLLCGLNIPCTLTGSEQLLRRPMQRVVHPLRELGADLKLLSDGGIEIEEQRDGEAVKQKIHLNIPSAQVKSAILLYAKSKGIDVVVEEKIPTRDHTERMLSYLNSHRAMAVPGDISSASFFIVASILSKDNPIICRDVLLNPRRTGLVRALISMGADIQLIKKRQFYGEISGDIEVFPSKLSRTVVDKNIPDLIDELPILVLAATQSRGTTIIQNSAELRVKETDRIKTTAQELNKMGANVDVMSDGFIIDGPTPLVGCESNSHGDHRLAMMLKIASTVATGITSIENFDCYQDSCPEFMELFGQVG